VHYRDDTSSICAVLYCPSDDTPDDADNEVMIVRRASHPIHQYKAAVVANPPPVYPLPVYPAGTPSPAADRVPVMIDPSVRAALHAHLINVYSGSGVGYSEWIRRALTWDHATQVPGKVRPDKRTHGPDEMLYLDEEAQK